MKDGIIMRIKVKHVLLFLFQFVLLIGIITSYIVANIGNEVYKEDEKQETKGIAMMLEQTAGMGNYKVVTRKSWPGDGYIFNANLSNCKNNSKLIWDEDKRTVTYSGRFTDNCTIYFDIYNLGVINSVSYVATTSSLTITAKATAGYAPIDKYYFSIDNGVNYIETADNVITFNNLEPNTSYTIKIKVKDINGKEGAVVSRTFKTKIMSIAEVCSTGDNLINCIQAFAAKGSNVSNIYVHDSNLTNGAGDGSYRYAGPSESVNNFVCFGSSASTCPSDNLYRIIGVFGSNNHGISYNLVKLIKYDYASKNLLGSDGNYYGSTTPPKSLYKGALSSVDTYTWKNNANAWSWSSLNKTNLNTNFLSNIGTTWADKIISVNWVTGGNTSAKVINTTAKNAYANEITSPASTLTTANKIGMMYVSDYGFAATPSAWSSNISNYYLGNISSNNWMYMGMQEWTNTRDANDSVGVFYIHYGASVDVGAGADYELEDGIGIAVRPCFYLANETKYLSGTGEKSSPIRIE